MLLVLTSINLIMNTAEVIRAVETSYVIYIVCEGKVVVCKEVRFSAEANGCIAFPKTTQMQLATLICENYVCLVAVNSNHTLECAQLQEKKLVESNGMLKLTMHYR